MALACDTTTPRYLGAVPIRVKDLIKRLKIAVKVKRPVMIWGDPGVGKSAIVASFAADVGLGYAFLTLASAAPEDVQGIPVFTGGIDGAISRKLIAAFRTAAERGCILHIDEVTCASPAMLGAILSAIQDRRIGDTMLHPDTVVVLSANPPGTTSGGTEPSLALVNRCAHYFLTPDVADFGKYLTDRADRESDPVLAKWLRLGADLLDLGSDRLCLIEFSAPESEVRDWATPRAIEAMIEEVAAFESEGFDPYTDPMVRDAIVARIGRKAGTAWVGIMNAAAKLPRPAAIAANPDAAPVPTLADLDLALACIALTPAVIALNPAAAYVWADRFTAREIRTLMHRTLTAAGAFPVGGFKGALAPRAETARQNLTASFNAIAAGK